MKLQKVFIINHYQLTNNVYRMDLHGDFLDAKAGQFIHIKIGKNNRYMLRRPISIADISKDGISIIYRVNGEGTEELSQYKVGDYLDVLGPLGNGYDIDKIIGDKVVLFGGGIGVPPMLELAKQLSKRGKEVISILGFRNREDVFLENEFKQYGKTLVTTSSGDYGLKGYVTEVYKEDFDSYCACGPIAMLKSLQEKYKDKLGYISIEKRMACGIGACYACVCNKDEDYTRVCIDGPVYLANEVELCD